MRPDTTDHLPHVSTRPRIVPNALFFPAAVVHAAIVLPWSVLAMTGLVGAPPLLASGAGHAHEMLLGYALAVVAGYQLPVVSPRRLAALFTLWMLARAAFLLLPFGIAVVPDIAFAAALAWHVAPRLFRAAKKLRNQALPTILTLLCVAAAASAAALGSGSPQAVRRLLTAVVLLLASLMLFMGGRIIAPAVAGEFYRQGRSLAARVQPAIEGSLLALMAIALLSLASETLEALLRLACVSAGLLACVRLLRWRLWECSARRDLLCLGAGYGWIAAGLCAIAAAGTGPAGVVALHLVTIGALGTVSFNVMAQARLRRRGREPAREPMLVRGTGLIALATLLRVAAFMLPAAATHLLVIAAACWSAAFLHLLGLMAGGAWSAARARH